MSLSTINQELTGITGTTAPLAKNLESLITEVSSTYTEIITKGGDEPAAKNTQNLANAIGGIIDD